MHRSHTQLDATYYISRVLIPPLERIFNLVGADVRQWYNEMPKARQIDVVSPGKKGAPQVIESDAYNINEHFDRSECLICGDFALQGMALLLVASCVNVALGLCARCWKQPQSTLAGVLNRIGSNEQRLNKSHRVCASCTGTSLQEAAECQSLDCSWLFVRKKAEARIEFLEILHELVKELVDENSVLEEEMDDSL